MYLSEALKDSHGLQLVSGKAEGRITSVTSDSRLVMAGSVFVAIKGKKFDGHDFIADAVQKGAVAIVSEQEISGIPEHISVLRADSASLAYAALCARFYPARPGMMVAVTGTNGKTSCVEYMRQIWTRATWPAATIGTLGIACPDPELASSSSELTTPQSEILFSVLHKLAKSGVTHAACEASSQGLAQNRLAGLAVNVALFTNLSRDHLDWHGDMDSYFEAKARLFDENLLDGGTAVLNADCPYAMRLKDRLKDRQIVIWTVGRQKEADFRIDAIESQPFGLDVQISAKGQQFRFPLALSGTFQAENAVMAAVCAYASGMPLQDSFGALPALQPVRGRMQPIHGHHLGARVIIDFAHTPDALETALKALREQTPDKLWLVFGCGGERDKGKRAEMGKIAGKLADHIIITDDNPRSEDPAAIRAEIRSACPDAREISPRDQAIKTAILSIQQGDTLLIAGKGHETVQMIGTETLPFDDASVARHMISNSFSDGGGND